MLLYKEDGGFHNFRDDEVEQAKKDGWVDGAPVWAALIAAKMERVEPDTTTRQWHASKKSFLPEQQEQGKIVTHARRGRSRREEQAATVEVPNGDSTDTD